MSNTSHPLYRTRAERDAIIEQHMSLVRFVVGKLRAGLGSTDLDYEDLVAHGVIGLIQAVDRFDGSQGIQFSSYAAPRIRGAILDAIRSLDPVGRAGRRYMRAIDQAHDQLSTELGREPTHEEIQRASGIDDRKYWETRRAATVSVVPIDRTVDEDGHQAQVADDSPMFTDEIEHLETLRALEEGISMLPERERLILSLYYVEKLTLREIAAAVDVSETRVSQLLHRAYARLRMHPGLAAA